jgi:hypothetical protein
MGGALNTPPADWHGENSPGVPALLERRCARQKKPSATPKAAPRRAVARDHQKNNSNGAPA